MRSGPAWSAGDPSFRWDDELGYRSSMRTAAIALVALALASCDFSPRVDCKAVLERMPDCIAKNRSGPPTDCEPYSKPQRIEGTWASDFEFEEFYEGREVAPAEAWQIQRPTTKIMLKEPLHKDANGNPKAIVTYLVFEGRRPLCDITPEWRIIMVDRIISERVIEARRSRWFS